MREGRTQALLPVLLRVMSGDEIVFPSPLFSCAGMIRCSDKPAGRRLSRRALIHLTVLEFETKVSLEYLILIERIDTDVAEASGAECVVDLPGIGVGEVEEYGIRQHVPGSHSHAVQGRLVSEQLG